MKPKFTELHLVLLSLLFFTLCSIIIWVQITNRISLYEQNIEEIEDLRATNNLNKLETQLVHLYKISRTHVLYIKDLLEEEKENDLYNGTSKAILTNFLQRHPNYFEAQLTDTTGTEILRLVKDTYGIVKAIPLAKDHMDTPYYTSKVRQLTKEKIYVSNIELNGIPHNGVTEQRPTVRFFVPIFNKDKKKGILGLSINISHWFTTIDKPTTQGILNSGNESYFGDQLTLYAPNEIDLNKKDAHGHPVYRHKKLFLDGGNFLTLYTRINLDRWHTKVADFKKNTLTTGYLLCVIIMLILTICLLLFFRNKKTTQLNNEIEERLNERDVLMKEIHHRVKNNFQVVASLLSLQANSIKDVEAKKVLKYSQYRIYSMGIIHELLYKNENFDRVDFGVYLDKLVNRLIVSMKGFENEIGLHLEISNIYFNVDTAIPLGLIINEIITNSLKYGFINTSNGYITIKLDRTDQNAYALLIGDNGVGMPESIDFTNTKSLGLKLINKLTYQLNGNVAIDRSNKGTYYHINFQEIKKSA